MLCNRFRVNEFSQYQITKQSFASVWNSKWRCCWIILSRHFNWNCFYSNVGFNQGLIGKRFIGLRKFEHNSYDSASNSTISSEIDVLIILLSNVFIYSCMNLWYLRTQNAAIFGENPSIIFNGLLWRFDFFAAFNIFVLNRCAYVRIKTLYKNMINILLSRMTRCRQQNVVFSNLHIFYLKYYCSFCYDLSRHYCVNWFTMTCFSE